MSDRAYYNLASNGIKPHGRRRKSRISVADRGIARVHGTRCGPLSTKLQWHVALSCIVGWYKSMHSKRRVLSCGTRCTDLCKCEEGFFNNTIRAGMACKTIAQLRRLLLRNIITTLDDHDPQHHNVCLSFGVNISVSCLLYCNTIVQEHLEVLCPILLLARTVDLFHR